MPSLVTGNTLHWGKKTLTHSWICFSKQKEVLHECRPTHTHTHTHARSLPVTWIIQQGAGKSLPVCRLWPWSLSLAVHKLSWKPRAAWEAFHSRWKQPQWLVSFRFLKLCRTRTDTQWVSCSQVPPASTQMVCVMLLCAAGITNHTELTCQVGKYAEFVSVTMRQQNTDN